MKKYYHRLYNYCSLIIIAIKSILNIMINIIITN